MRQRRPESKFSMQYDKLIIDHEIYMFNDMTGRVEEVSLTGQKSSFNPRTPQDLNRGLHTDFCKSETSRDIKNSY